MLYEQYLEESSYTGGYPNTGGLCGNDDKAPSTVLMGDVTVRVRSRESINGLLNIHKPLKNYIWHEMEYAEAAADLDNYHQTLTHGDTVYDKKNIDLFRHTDSKFDDKDRPYRKGDRKPDAKISDNGYDKIDLKRFGISVLVKQRAEGATEYKYPTNEDLTLELVDIADEIGCRFDILDEDGECRFTMLSEMTLIGSIEPDDDYPVGNIVWGEKMEPELIPSLSGNLMRWKSDPNFTWTEFERCRGMDDRKNYHSSLLGIEKLINRDDFTLWKYVGKGKDDAQIMKKRLKINAKEPTGKEPTTSVKVDVTKGDMKTKEKETNKKKEDVQVGKTIDYADINATSIDKDISKTVMKHIQESNDMNILDKIDKYLNEERVVKGDRVEILRKDVHKDLKKIKGPRYGKVISRDGDYILVKSEDIPKLEMELYPNEIKKINESDEETWVCDECGWEGPKSSLKQPGNKCPKCGDTPPTVHPK